MGKVIAYIATSLDGYVARSNHDLSWLESFEGEDDHGFEDFMQDVGAVLMGARTYEQLLEHPERKLASVRNYVLSHRPLDILENVDVEFCNGGPVQAVDVAQRYTHKNIFVVGGGKVISSLVAAAKLDELWHFVAPILLGEGIPLYTSIQRDIKLGLKDVKAYADGLVRLRYHR